MTDTDPTDGRDRAAHFERVARQALHRETKDQKRQALEPAAGALLRAISGHDPAGQALFRYVEATDEYAGAALRAFRQLGDVATDGPTDRLYQAGANVASACTAVGVALDAPERDVGYLPDQGTPRHAAAALRDAYDTLDAVAADHGQPLPADLSPSDGREGAESRPTSARERREPAETPMTPERVRAELEAIVSAAERADVTPDRLAEIFDQYADACRAGDPYVVESDGSTAGGEGGE